MSDTLRTSDSTASPTADADMTRPAPVPARPPTPTRPAGDPTRPVRAYFEARDWIRRGTCLLAARNYEQAERAFQRAQSINPNDRSLASLLAASRVGRSDYAGAAAHLRIIQSRRPHDPTARIRHAWALWSSGHRPAAVNTLRQAISDHPNGAELQFQLGTMLSSLQQYEEAELRFAQALAIDKDHVDAMVHLGLCLGARGCPREAVKVLQRAHRQRGGDASIALLLTRAARGAEQQGPPVHLRLVLPPEEDETDDDGLEELARAIMDDPEFVDAILAVPAERTRPDVYATLLHTVQRALERRPEHADLQAHCGAILERLGRLDEAIAAGERAVRIDPTHARALIELARRYQRDNRNADAVERLEQVVRMGCEYADVYYMLGNAHRACGRLEEAGEAYRRALSINERYDHARDALTSLSR